MYRAQGEGLKVSNASVFMYKYSILMPLVPTDSVKTTAQQAAVAVKASITGATEATLSNETKISRWDTKITVHNN